MHNAHTHRALAQSVAADRLAAARGGRFERHEHPPPPPAPPALRRRAAASVAALAVRLDRAEARRVVA